MSKCRTNDCSSNDCCSPDDFGYSAAKYLNTAQSFTATCESGTGDPVTITIAAGEYCSKTSQADADARALAAATAQAQRELCCCEECPECPECDDCESGPLDSAIYSADDDAIFGVRSGYVSKFNVTTGEKEAQARFEFGFGPSDICLHDDGFLYVAFWHDPRQNLNFATQPNYKSIYKINPTDLSVVGSFDISTLGSNTPTRYQDGPCCRVISADGYLWYLQRAPTFVKVVYFDPNNVADTGQPDNTSDDNWADLFWNPVTGYVAFATAFSIERLHRDGFHGSKNTTKRNMGVVALDDGRYYAVTRSQYISRVTLTGGFNAGTETVIDTGVATLRPFRIRYRQSNSMLYVPGGPTDTVLIIDPASDTIVATKSGFDSPWDVVFTGSKAFAVQLGANGLKEIV